MWVELEFPEQLAVSTTARVHRQVWAQVPALPASRVAGGGLGGTVVLDGDATLVVAHSGKEQARPTF